VNAMPRAMHAWENLKINALNATLAYFYNKFYLEAALGDVFRCEIGFYATKIENTLE